MTDTIPILEFRSVRGTGGGPEKTILLAASQADPHHFPTTVCYLRDRRDRTFEIDARARHANVDYVEVVEGHSFDWRVWPELRQVVRQRGIRIVHAHDYKTDLLALLLARTERVVPLATVHGWTGHNWRERHVYYPADRWILSKFPRLIAVSEQVRGELIAAGARPERVMTILNGIDHLAFRRDRARESDARTGLGIAPQDMVLGAVGRLEPQKRFDILIDVFAGLVSRHPNLRLLIAGDGSQRETLSAQVRTLGLGMRCQLLGLRSDVAVLHHAFDVFVQSSDYEGTPNAVLEAMALETPVVATDVGGTREIARHGVEALIVAPRDPQALGAAIEETLGNPAAAAARAARARARVEHDLSFSARTAAVERIYEELAGEAGGTDRSDKR